MVRAAIISQPDVVGLKRQASISKKLARVSGMEILDKQSQDARDEEIPAQGVSYSRLSKKSFVIEREKPTGGGKAQDSGHENRSIGSNASSVRSMISANVTVLYQQKQKSLVSSLSQYSSPVQQQMSLHKQLMDPSGMFLQPYDVIMRKLEDYGSRAEAYATLNQFENALRKHLALQDLALARLVDTSDLKNSQEANLRFELADSTYRMGLIYDEPKYSKRNACMAAKLYNRALDYYNDLKTHLVVTGLITIGEASWSRNILAKFNSPNKHGDSVRQDLEEALETKKGRKIKLVYYICDVMLSLAKNYQRQEKFHIALKTCEDALTILGEDDSDRSAWLVPEETTDEIRAKRKEVKDIRAAVEKQASLDDFPMRKSVNMQLRKKNDLMRVSSDSSETYTTYASSTTKRTNFPEELSKWVDDCWEGVITLCYPKGGTKEMEEHILSMFESTDQWMKDMKPKSTKPKRKTQRKRSKDDGDDDDDYHDDADDGKSTEESYFDYYDRPEYNFKSKSGNQ